MNITQQDDGKHGVFFAKDGDGNAGEMTYTWQDETVFIINRTHVEDSHKGQGIGRMLLDTAVAFAREKHLKIIPVCPYAKAVFEKDDSIGDVLFKDN